MCKGNHIISKRKIFLKKLNNLVYILKICIFAKIKNNDKT